MKKRKFRNPHVRRMISIARKSGLQVGQHDLDAARRHNKPKPCTRCGAKAWYKPTVNAYICTICGHVLR